MPIQKGSSLKSQEKDRDTLERKLALFLRLGGLPDTEVSNQEWLYMLQLETRHSLSIEGHFSTESELKAVLNLRKSYPEILNYYRTAQGQYDLALQYRREGDFRLDLPLVRHIHSELFRELSSSRGEFRRGSIEILGAKVHPPTFDVELYVRAFVALVPTLLERFSLLSALARIHTLFESIHPFEDGNGRAGRILMNTLAVSKGLPPIIIKGLDAPSRERYYQALEAADVGFQSGFPEPTEHALQTQLELGDFAPLETLLLEAVLPQLDTVLALSAEKHAPLLDFATLALELKVQEATLRQWVRRGHLVALKRGRKLYSNTILLLERDGP
jgi:Fic family protein